ncbi:MAG: F0F1 ATP synthase subunit B [Coriobacteriaceae bacterium]|nr:F0F1 ATP synthase subunit B [Coriobacteriaceae bacterium]
MEMLIPNLGEFIPTLIAFIVLVIILAKFGWPAIIGILDRRKEKIESDLGAAEEARVEGERTLEEYKAQLADARQEAATIVAEAKQQGAAVQADLTAQAQAEADQIVAKARDEIESEKRAAIAELQSSVADLTVAVASRVVGEDLTDAEHRKLIERCVDEAGSLDA